MSPISMEERIKIWTGIIMMLAHCTDLNQKSVLLQTAISEFGPVPDKLGEAVREALK